MCHSQPIHITPSHRSKNITIKRHSVYPKEIKKEEEKKFCVLLLTHETWNEIHYSHHKNHKSQKRGKNDKSKTHKHIEFDNRKLNNILARCVSCSFLDSCSSCCGFVFSFYFVWLCLVGIFFCNLHLIIRNVIFQRNLRRAVPCIILKNISGESKKIKIKKVHRKMEIYLNGKREEFILNSNICKDFVLWENGYK